VHFCNILRRYIITLSKDGYFGRMSSAMLWPFVALFVASAAVGAVHTVMAKISYSKDWAVVVACATTASGSTQDKQSSQTDLNALMQRIDLINDIIIPVVFGAIISETSSYRGLPKDTIGFGATAATKIMFYPLQMMLLAGMPKLVPELLAPKVPKAKAAAVVAPTGIKAKVRAPLLHHPAAQLSSTVAVRVAGPETLVVRAALARACCCR
jgi:hypothetical protein